MPLPGYPVLVIHLEDPPGSGLAACCGEPLVDVTQTERYANVPAWACTGCVRPTARDLNAKALNEALKDHDRELHGDANSPDIPPECLRDVKVRYETKVRLA